MTQTNRVDFFLGANTPSGFKSLFYDSYDTSDWRVFIIKGGPGSGKSSLMRKVAEKAAELGENCEMIHCSSDPDSLDAVILPGRRAAIYDGTSPHVMEPRLIGACENIVNMGDAWDSGTLRKFGGEIKKYSQQCAFHHAHAKKLLYCASALRENTALIVSSSINRDKIVRAADSIAAKKVGRRKAKGSEVNRLLSAVTPNGTVFYGDSITKLCGSVVPIDDRFAAASGELMERLRSKLLESGHNIITCRCSQSDRVEHILLPEESVAFTVRNDYHSLKCAARSVHGERFLSGDTLEKNKQHIVFNRKTAAQFIEQASAEMRSAKAIHDKLEKIYIETMDFEKADAIAESVIKRMLD